MANTKKNFSALRAQRLSDELTADLPAEEAAPVAAPALADTEPAQEARPKEKNTPPTAEELRIAQQNGKTRGRKGFAMPRINMCFKPDIYEYITIMARARGMSIAQFTDFVFRKSMADNAAFYEQVKAWHDMQ